MDMENQKKSSIHKTVSNDIKISLLDEDNTQAIESICKALSSPVRLSMVRQLHESPMTIMELAKRNGITNSTAIFHLNILQESGIVKVKYLPSQKGIAQVNFIAFQNVILTRDGGKTSGDIMIDEQSLGVGCYADASLDSFGFATDKELFHITVSEFDQRRFGATLIWTFGGTATYHFPNFNFRSKRVTKLQFSLELCSETTCYRNDWKSDIFFAVNGVEVAHYLSPGDFGGERARFTPSWWPRNMTQYGKLVVVDVTDEGTFVNHEKVSDKTLADVAPCRDNKIAFTVFNKKDSTYYGGFNLFGRGAGNYDQDIVLTTYYQD